MLNQKLTTMKTFKVTYNGNSSMFRNLNEEVNANSEREAVEKVYSDHLDHNYFKQDDGSVKDCDGNVIATATDDQIEFDGGFFVAEEVK
jgi:hypothetical protein